MSEKLKLWFFRDLADEQRLKLFGLFGLPVDEIGSHHGRQSMALRHITQKLVELVRDEAAPASQTRTTPSPTEAPPVESQAAAMELAERLADQVDHCLLGYAISRQNSMSIQEAMLQLRVACNDFRAALAAEGSAE